MRERNSDILEHYVQQDGSIFTIGGDDKKRSWNLVVPCAKPEEFITKADNTMRNQELQNLRQDNSKNR